MEFLGLRACAADRREDDTGISSIVPPRQVTVVMEGKKQVRMSNLYKKRPGIARYICKRVGITNSPQLTSRIKHFLTRRDDKIYIATQSITTLLYLSVSGKEEKLPLIESLRTKYLLSMLKFGTDRFTSIWKDASTALSNLLSRNVLEEAKTRDDLDIDAKEVYDDLLNFYGRAIRDEPDEEEFYFYAYIQQARFLPLPSMRATGEKIIEYIGGLVKDRSTEHDDKAFQVGQILSDKVEYFAEKQGKKLYSNTHLSLSSGSCWEASRKSLGKWHIMLPQSELTEFLDTPCGNIFNEDKVGPILDMYGNTICSQEDAHLPLWQIAYLEEPLEGSLGKVYTIHENLGTQFEQGFDARLGLLIFLWASLKKIEYEQSSAESILKAKLIIIGEPSAKIRPLTSGETWAYLYMVPAMHMLKEAIECLPGARVGLTEHENLWRFGTSYENHYGDGYTKEIPEYISSSDLSSATDRFGHQLARNKLKGFVLGCKASEGVKQYLMDSIELCCSPRQVHFKTTHRLARKIRNSVPEVQSKDSKREITFTTQCGVMMGDPITKVLLTMASMASWYCTQVGFEHLKDVSFASYMERTYLKRRVIYKTPGSSFACAGDDHTAVGNKRDVIRPPKFLQSMNLEISWDKYCISKKYVSYCQAFGYAPRWKRSIHSDTVKVRLLNEFRKQGGHDSFEEPDPLVGKARDLERSLRHFSNNEYKNFIEGVIPPALRGGMPKWFETKVYKKDQAYMPSSFGGLGIPSRIDWTQSSKCCSIYKTYCLNHVPGLLTQSAKQRAWHRGQEFNEQVLDISSNLGGKTFNEIWRDTQDRLDSGSSTPSGSKRVQRTIYKEYVRIDEPCVILGTKESTPAMVYTKAALQSVIKPNRRSRQVLIQKARLYHINNSLVDSIPYEQVDMADLHKKRPGIWISRGALHERLKIAFSAPKLGFSTAFLDGQVRNFASDSSSPYYGGSEEDREFEYIFDFDDDLSQLSEM
jgi:hypothetical protein